MSQETIKILEETAPKDLKAMHLLKQHGQQDNRLIPQGVAREDIQAATRELIQYTKTCQDLAERLRNLRPIPLQNDQWQYGL